MGPPIPVIQRRMPKAIGRASNQASKSGYPLTLELKVAELRKPTRAKISQIRTVSVQRIGKPLARIPPTDVTKVIEGLLEILGE
jgi:mRNA interferase MazF